MERAVETALTHYPSIQVSQAQVEAAGAGIRLARTAYLPKLDAIAQINRATRNNVFGMLLPQSVIPNISGPVLNSNNFGTVWGSAVGMLVTWEPFDFGLRSANIAIADAQKICAEASVKRTQFEVAVTTADAYLGVAAAQEMARAAQAAVERVEVVLKTTRALADAELRPGADVSRVEAELAAARTQVIQAEQAVEIAKATVTQFTGIESTQITLAAPGLLRIPPEAPVAPLDAAANPNRFYGIDEARSRETGGAGLGLAIAKWGAEAHGGRLDLAEERGRGSVFRILFS